MSVIPCMLCVIINLTTVSYNRSNYTGDPPSNHRYYDSFPILELDGLQHSR